MDPSPTRWRAVVRAERATTGAVLDGVARLEAPQEAGGRTGDAVAAIGAHLDAIEDVVSPMVGSLDPAGVEALDGAAALLRQALTAWTASPGPDGVPTVRRAWGGYCSALDEVIAELADAGGERLMERLGLDFRECLEARTAPGRAGVVAGS